MSNRQIYAIFHLNLAFSSIDESEHNEVIEQCYWPLLNIIEKEQIPLGLELTAYTLEKIQAVSPEWIDKFRYLLAENYCELLASGDSQIIGPLVPAQVNTKNLELGQAYYEHVLGIVPKLAYVNEQAVSSGLLDIYLNTGFDAVVVEWDNPYSHNSAWSPTLLHRPQTLETASKRKIKVIWNNAIAFQKLQRYAHAEITQEDYLSYLEKTIVPTCTAFCLYGNDAEVFNFRPARYATEAQRKTLEWQRIADVFTALKRMNKFCWVKPSDVLTQWQDAEALSITTAMHPISVKKQAKYNITRWGLSGRNDLIQNALCYQRFHALENKHESYDDEWRKLCRLWASDLRTHLTEHRYTALLDKLTVHDTGGREFNIDTPPPANYEITYEEKRSRLTIHSDSVRITLNTYRGLAIESLAFAEHDFKPVCGTLAHGYFDHIRYGADFFSNHLVIERFRARDRVTDLCNAHFMLSDENGRLLIHTTLPTEQGNIVKWYRLDHSKVECGFEFTNKVRPEASLRLGFITLTNCQYRPWFACLNGGFEQEYFLADTDFDHGAPVSSIVSASSALGATSGEIRFGNGNQGVKLSWNPADCAALPMLSSKKINAEYLNRLWFSLIEADETLKSDGILPSFNYSIAPCDKPAEISFLE